MGKRHGKTKYNNAAPTQQTITDQFLPSQVWQRAHVTPPNGGGGDDANVDVTPARRSSRMKACFRWFRLTLKCILFFCVVAADPDKVAEAETRVDENELLLRSGFLNQPMDTQMQILNVLKTRSQLQTTVREQERKLLKPKSCFQRFIHWRFVRGTAFFSILIILMAWIGVVTGDQRFLLPLTFISNRWTVISVLSITSAGGFFAVCALILAAGCNLVCCKARTKTWSGIKSCCRCCIEDILT